MKSVVLFISCALWLGNAYAQNPTNPEIVKELVKQESIYQSKGDQVPKGYSIDRTLEDYTRGLTGQFGRTLASLGPKDRWLDIGAGAGQAMLDYHASRYDSEVLAVSTQPRGKAQSVAISIEDRRTPRWLEETARLGEGKVRYLFSKRLQDYSQADLGKFQVITDVIGGFSYSNNLSHFLEKVLQLLEVNGIFFTLLQDVQSEGGTNAPHYAGAPYLTEIKKADGSNMKVCTWLKSISCVEVNCEFTTSWTPPIEAYQVRKVCDTVNVPALTPTHFASGTPPERRFRIGVPVTSAPAQAEAAR